VNLLKYGPYIKSENEPKQSLTVTCNTPLYQLPVNTDWEDPVLCRFFADYTIDTNNLKVNPGFLHNLSRLFNEATPHDELLVQAIRAVSLANFCTQSRSDQFLIKSRKAYGQCLVLLKQALSNENLTNVSALAGVLLLNMYDVSSPPCITVDVGLLEIRCTVVKGRQGLSGRPLRMLWQRFFV
jgi:hypothetical protein